MVIVVAGREVGGSLNRNATVMEARAQRIVTLNFLIEEMETVHDQIQDRLDELREERARHQRMLSEAYDGPGYPG